MIVKFLQNTFWLMMLLAILSIMAIAQNEEQKIRVETNLVSVNVLITDKNGKFVKGLEREAFEVYDNNVKQQIEHFSDQNKPVSFGVVYDMHPTTGEMTKAVIESLRQFSKELRTDDDIFMMAFNMNGMQKFDFIPTVEQLDKFMLRPEKREPNSLYDTVFTMADKMRTRRNLKQTILIISDSKDHMSRHNFSELRRKLKSFDIEIYAVILDDDKWDYRDIRHGDKMPKVFTDANRLDRAAIQELALKTGGTYFSGSQNTLQLYSIYKQITDEMNNHYTLGFYPDMIDGKQHSLRIRLRNLKQKDSKYFVLTYRQEYLIQK